jgi:hypothetical protein
VLAIRQNLSIGGRHPVGAVGSLGARAHFATDALSYYGSLRARPAARRARDARPAEPRCQHEHSLAALQDEAVSLAPGAQAARGFFGWLELDHAAPAPESDLAIVEPPLALPEAKPPPQPSAALDARWRPPRRSSRAQRRLEARSARSRRDRRAVRQRTPRVESRRRPAAVVLPRRGCACRAAEKERTSLRSHGQILRSARRWFPRRSRSPRRCVMGGVFHSMVTQGHVSINGLLSTTHGYLGLFRSHGQRVFVELEDGYRLLDDPPRSR